MPRRAKAGVGSREWTTAGATHVGVQLEMARCLRELAPGFAHTQENMRERTPGMDQLLREHLEATYFAEYQLLRDELMGLLTDDDLAYRPATKAFSLGELCREIGEIEHAYVEAFRTFRQTFDWRNPDPRIDRSVEALRAWYADLDGSLAIALEALTQDDVADRRVTRHDYGVDEFSPHPRQELDIYREALLIFYGKVSVYLRAMGKALPRHWQEWIG